MNDHDDIVAELWRVLDGISPRPKPRLVWVNPSLPEDDTLPSECNPDDGDVA